VCPRASIILRNACGDSLERIDAGVCGGNAVSFLYGRRNHVCVFRRRSTLVVSTERTAYALLILLASLSLVIVRRVAHSRSGRPLACRQSHRLSRSWRTLQSSWPRAESAWLLFRFGTGAPSSSQSQLCDDCPRRALCIDCPVSAMKLHVCDEAALLRTSPGSWTNALGFARSTLSAKRRARPPLLCLRVFARSRSVRRGLEPVVPDRSHRVTSTQRWEAQRRLPVDFRELASRRETSGSPPLPLRIGVYGIIGGQEEDLGTLTGSPLPTQEARCRSGSGSCSG
jgi:hypothetical protein